MNSPSSTSDESKQATNHEEVNEETNEESTNLPAYLLEIVGRLDELNINHVREEANEEGVGQDSDDEADDADDHDEALWESQLD